MPEPPFQHLRTDRRALARAMSTLEEDGTDASSIATAAFRLATGAIVGVTGSPGAGKSTLVDGLILHLRERECRVGVVAVDPASPFTGGAILGDRIRMQRHVDDPDVFIRSMSTRGHLGGMAAKTSKVATLLSAAGFDPVLVETVGVGQSEIDVVHLAHVTVLVVAPGFGDGVQAAKAGVLEIADVIVVNKADQPGAEELTRELRAVTDDVPVVSTVATTGEGISEMWHAVAERLDGQMADPTPRARRLIEAAVAQQLSEAVRSTEVPDQLVADVADRRRDPWSIAEQLVP